MVLLITSTCMSFIMSDVVYLMCHPPWQTHFSYAQQEFQKWPTLKLKATTSISRRNAVAFLFLGRLWNLVPQTLTFTKNDIFMIINELMSKTGLQAHSVKHPFTVMQFVCVCVCVSMRGCWQPLTAGQCTCTRPTAVISVTSGEWTRHVCLSCD